MSDLAANPNDAPTSELPEAKPSSRIARTTLVYVAFQLMSWAATFLTERFVQTRLGEAAVGDRALAGSILMAAASIFGFGLNNYLISEIGRSPERAEYLVRNAWGLRAAAAFPMAFAAICYLRFVLHASTQLMQLGYIATAIVSKPRAAYF